MNILDTEVDKVLVSIIVPMYNAEAYISKTLISLLSESEIPIEVIVVNDRSTDASLARVLQFRDSRIRVVEGPGRGAAAAMNTGFAEARGAIVMHCDADDLYPEKRISKQVTWLAAHPEYDAICGAFSTIDSSGHHISELQCGSESADITGELLQGRVRTSLCTYAIRKESKAKAGIFREYFESSYDIDMQLRLCEVNRIGYVPENFYFYRLHASSITHHQSNIRLEFFERTAHDFQKQRRTSGMDDLQRGRPPSKPESGASPSVSADEHIQNLLFGRAWREHAEGRRWDALRTGISALILRPGNWQAWKSIFALALVASKEANRH